MAKAAFLHGCLVEVHVDESAIDLCDAVLEAGGNTEFLCFDG